MSCVCTHTYIHVGVLSDVYYIHGLCYCRIIFRSGPDLLFDLTVFVLPFFPSRDRVCLAAGLVVSVGCCAAAVKRTTARAVDGTIAHNAHQPLLRSVRVKICGSCSSLGSANRSLHRGRCGEWAMYGFGSTVDSPPRWCPMYIYFFAMMWRSHLQ